MNSLEQKINIYAFSFTRHRHLLDKYYSILSKCEKQKVDMLNFNIHKQRYIITRGILRTILSMYLNLKPENITFNYSKKGKPFINNVIVKFNLSHTQDMGIIAVNLNDNLGIDIEKEREILFQNQIVDRFFSKKEKNIYAELNCEKKKFFFSVWTRKEAYVKAQGGCLTNILSKFDVLSPQSSIKKFNQPLLINNYRLVNLNFLDNHFISLCYEGEEKDVQCLIY